MNSQIQRANSYQQINFDRGIETFQNIIVEVFNHNPVLASVTRSWFARLEYGLGSVDDLFDEATRTLIEFLQHFSSRGAVEFIRNIRAIVSNYLFPVNSREESRNLLNALKTDVYILYNVKKALIDQISQDYQRLAFVAESSINSYAFSVWGIVPANSFRVLERSLTSPWRYEWRVAIYHGGDTSRVRNSLIRFTMNKAARKLDKHHRKLNRLVEKRNKLTNRYIRRLTSYERRLSAQWEKIERSVRRAENLRLKLDDPGESRGTSPDKAL